MSLEDIETKIVKEFNLIDMLKSFNADYIGMKKADKVTPSLDDGISVYLFKLNNGNKLPIPFYIRIHKIGTYDYVRVYGDP